MRWITWILAVGACIWTPISAFAQNPPSSPEDRMDAARKLVAGLHFQSGQVKVGNNLATLDLGDTLQYLGPQDARTVLVDLWGNPPGPKEPLGMIVPKNVDFFSPDSWAAVITYEEDGHVKDDDADKINYDQLLGEMQKSVSEENGERQKQGFAPVQLVGWAAPPKYDRDGKKLFWAKELKFGDDSESTLNYNIRILGRKGVLVINVIATLQALPKVEAATPTILSAVSFNPGNRYADYDAATDKLAAYGIAALVAGGVAAKLGFFKLLWVGILALKKFIIVGVIAAISFVRRFFAKRSS